MPRRGSAKTAALEIHINVRRFGESNPQLPVWADCQEAAQKF